MGAQRTQRTGRSDPQRAQRGPVPGFLLLLLLAVPGCIEDRLTVDITTRVLADGSCLRRTEYRLERVDTDKAEARVAIKPEMRARAMTAR